MQVLSSIPGRLRVAHPSLKNPRIMSDVLQCMERIDGLTSAEGQTITGSILIHYNDEILKELDLVHDLIDDIRGSFLPAIAAKRHAAFHKGNRQWRNFLQLGMLASLLVCTVTGFTKAKKTHLITGVLFLLVSAEHTRINRALLLR